MRERRWESVSKLDFNGVLALGERLAGWGLHPAPPSKEIICYIEEWTVQAPEDIDQLDPWATEDTTLVLIDDQWSGDFFLLAGAYHTVYQQHRDIGTYCSVSHPWQIQIPLRLHRPKAMFWLGFRHVHTFIRVRVHTTDVITPGETRADDQRDLWLAERRQAFSEAIAVLNVPIDIREEKRNVALRPEREGAPLFCSWPDAFGPCQFEYNSDDPFEFLVPASRLAATYIEKPVAVRSYLTGFSEPALQQFQAVNAAARSAYRCSVHCPVDELPDVLQAIEPEGRLYATLCEFSTLHLLPEEEEASAIIGIVGTGGAFQVEVRLNRAPLAEEAMIPWLERLLGVPVAYAPLPPFP